MPNSPKNIRTLFLAALLASSTLAVADDFIIDKEASMLGFINHKSGLAKALLVDPLAYPSEYTVNISLNPTIESAAFDLHYPVKNLQVAGPKVLDRWGPPILEAGATTKPLEAPSRSRQRKIRDMILSKKLMHEAKYPHVRARSLGIKKLSNRSPNTSHTHEITIEITIHGKTVTATFPSTIVLEGDHLTVNAALPLLQSEFGIKPYSGFFGTLRFKDTFHVYMHLEATRRTPSQSAD